jgi:Domain of Unknown Function (DUF748)
MKLKLKFITRGPWPRRFLISLIALVTLTLVVRLLTALLLPIVIDRVARVYGLDCTYDRLALSVLGGNAEIWNVELTPREGGAPILRADYCQGDVSLLNLLRGRLLVYRVATDGVDINVERSSDGRLPLLDRFVSATPLTPQPGTPTTLDFQPPLRIDALRLQHVRVRFKDQFVTPNFETNLALNLRLSDLGADGKPTQFEMDFSSDPMLDSLQIVGQGQSGGKTLAAQMTVLMRGLHIKPAAAYLASVGLRPVADDISASMSGLLNVSPASNPIDGVRAYLSLDRAHVTCDGEEAAAMDHLSLDAPSLTDSSFSFGNLSIAGVRCNARRGPDGGITAFGVEYSPAPRQSPSPTPAFVFPSFPVRLGKFVLSDFHARFADDAIAPPVALALDVARFSIDNPIPDRALPDSPIDFSANLAAPGMVRTIRLTGHAKPFASDKSFALAANAGGILLSAIQPYLTPLGLAPEWKDGSLRLAVTGTLSQAADGKLTASARLSDFHLTDPDNLLTLNDASIRSAGFDPRTATVHAGAIDISGPALSIRRDAAGDLHALGFRLSLNGAASNPDSAGFASTLVQIITEGRAGPIALLPNLDIGHFAWKDIRLNLQDASVQPPASLAISDAGLTVENFVFPPTIAGRGDVHAWIHAPNIAPELTLDGTITSAPRHIALESDLRGDGLRGDALASYLTPLGITPTLKSGVLRLHGKFEIASGPTFSLEVRDGRLTDGAESLISVPSMQIAALRARSGEISLDAVRMASPRIRIARNADGAVEVAGVLLAVQGEQSPFAPVYDFAMQGSVPPIPALALQHLQIQGADLHWIDHAVQPAVDTTADLSVDLSDFDFNRSARPATLHASASISGSLDSLTADGTLSASYDHQALNLKIAARGIRAGPAAAYLPPGVHVVLRDGRLHAAIALATRRNPRGGRAIDLTISDMGLLQGAEKPPLLDFTSLHVASSRLDPAAKLIALDDVTLKGCNVPIHFSSNGVVTAGLDLTSTPTAAASPRQIAPARAVSSSDDVLKQIAAERDRLPLILLKNLDLNCNSIAVTYDGPDHPAPVVISDLRVHNTSGLTWLGRDVESNPPTELDLTGQINPVADAFIVHVQAAPFLRQKTLGLDFLITGIHGAGLAAVAPSLMRGIDPSGLKFGQLSGSLTTSLRLQNVRQTDFSFAYGGKLDFSLRDLTLRADAGGPVLGGVQEIHSEGVAIGPDFSSVKSPELSIENITGHASRERDGIHFLGMTIPLPKKFSQPLAAADPPAVDPPGAVPAPSNVLTVDRLLISGMNFRMEDRTVDPPFVVPIDGLDVEAQGLSNLLVSRDKPIRFSALVNSGKIPFLRPGGKSPPFEDRQLFSQVTGNGVISFSPTLKGWAKASVSGFELASLRSVAKTYDVSLGGGTFDCDLDVRFPGDGSVDSSSRLVLTDLSLTEPPNGNLSHALSLPAPLDVVIGALEDQDGSITLPLNIALRQGQLDSGSVAAAASTAFLSVVATSVAASPLKAANLLGLNSSQSQFEPPLILSFPAGYPDLSSDQIAALRQLRSRLLQQPSLEVTIRHELGSDDIALAAERVNPAADDATDLADSLNRRRDELLAARRTADSDVRALLASTATNEAGGAIERLRAIDRQLADIDNALDHIYDLLRPGADRQAIRRTRQASLEIAAARLQAVRDLLLQSYIKRKIEPGRIHLTNAQFTAAPSSPSGELTISVVETK